MFKNQPFLTQVSLIFQKLSRISLLRFHESKKIKGRQRSLLSLLTVDLVA